MCWYTLKEIIVFGMIGTISLYDFEPNLLEPCIKQMYNMNLASENHW